MRRLRIFLSYLSCSSQVVRWPWHIAGRWFTMGGPALITACAFTPELLHEPLVLGERAAYLVVNKSPHQIIVMPRLLSHTDGQLLYANLHAASALPAAPQPLTIASLSHPQAGLAPALAANSQPPPFDQDPGDEDLRLPVKRTDSFAVAGAGHRVPEFVEVSWRALPRAGQNRFDGEPVKPIKVAVRSQIPSDVLAMVRDQWQLRLDIAIAASLPEPTLGWRLMSLAGPVPYELRRSGPW